MTNKKNAKTVATAAGVAVGAAVVGVALYAVIVGTYKWVQHDVRNKPEK